MSNTQTLHPTEGARFLFERQSEAEDHTSAVYLAAVYTPDQVYRYRVDMMLDGSVSIAMQDRSAGEKLDKTLTALARMMARTAGKKLADELPPWPHRVLRWRGPGRGG
ncbi:MAG: hypothetical protein AAGC55_00145 [Myxococcota bacterium]